MSDMYGIEYFALSGLDGMRHHKTQGFTLRLYIPALSGLMQIGKLLIR
jgi:hypothetical protein